MAEETRMPSVTLPKNRTLEDDLKETVRDLKRSPPMHPPQPSFQIEPSRKPDEYAPPNIRNNKQPEEKQEYTTLQAIAYSITRLTWKQAETMGAAIQNKMKDGVGTGSLTAAIQAWAEDWEKFDI